MLVSNTKPPGKLSNRIVIKYKIDSAIADWVSTLKSENNETITPSRTPSPPTDMGRLVAKKIIGIIMKYMAIDRLMPKLTPIKI